MKPETMETRRDKSDISCMMLWWALKSKVVQKINIFEKVTSIFMQKDSPVERYEKKSRRRAKGNLRDVK